MSKDITMKNSRPNQESLSWDQVEKYLQEKTAGGDGMALIETDKIFKGVLTKLGFPGKDTDQQVMVLSFVFSDYDNLANTRRHCKKLKEKIDFDISSEDVKKYLSVYYQAIHDLIVFKKGKVSWWRKIKLYLKLYIPRPKKFSKKFILIIFLFFLSIFVLDSTDFGRIIVDMFVSISHLIFSWVLFVILLIAGIAILVIGTIYYFESRKSKNIKT